jgi:membrane protein DedA with SNARE-associated domain/membrane-associated phospholipid phosphatase
MLDSITSWILSLSGGWAIAVVFLGPALESSAFVGFLFPGEIAVLLGGVLAYQGRVSLGAVIAAAILGAIIGDTVGYWVGRRWGHQILRGIGDRIPFLKHRVDEHLDRARAYLKRRGGIAVLLGRFTAALRVMVPGLAGISDMHYPTFFAFNALGGSLWGTAFVLLGYFAGAAWERVAGYASTAGLILLALVVLGLVLARILRNVREHGAPLDDVLARIRPIAWLRQSFPTASAWLAARIDTSSPRGFALSLVVAVGAFSAWLFGGLTQDVIAHEEAVRYDPGILRFAVSHREGWLTGAMKGATWLGSDGLLIPIVAAVALWLILRRHSWRSAMIVVAALAGANLLYHLTKTLVARPRPPLSLHLVHVTGYAFPSGHATQALAGWSAIALVFVSGRSVRARLFSGIAVAVLVLAVGASRIYLGVHWWTDVMGGFALGGVWICLIGAVILWTAPRPHLRERASEPPEPVAA